MVLLSPNVSVDSSADSNAKTQHNHRVGVFSIYLDAPKMRQWPLGADKLHTCLKEIILEHTGRYPQIKWCSNTTIRKGVHNLIQRANQKGSLPAITYRVGASEESLVALHTVEQPVDVQLIQFLSDVMTYLGITRDTLVCWGKQLCDEIASMAAARYISPDFNNATICITPPPLYHPSHYYNLKCQPTAEEEDDKELFYRLRSMRLTQSKTRERRQRPATESASSGWESSRVSTRLPSVTSSEVLIEPEVGTTVKTLKSTEKYVPPPSSTVSSNIFQFLRCHNNQIGEIIGVALFASTVLYIFLSTLQ